MDPFLPSEVARLVYGYLEESKCAEAALSFLERSPHLSECLALHKEGRRFNRNPTGYSLSAILDEYCEIRSLVAERLQKLPENSAEKLRQCGNLIGQLRFLIDATGSGQTLLVSITVPPQGSSGHGTSSNVTSMVSNRTRTRVLSSSERLKRNFVRSAQDSKQERSKESDERVAATSSSMLPVEATPLESLPGTTGNLDTQSTQTLRDGGNSRDCDHDGKTVPQAHLEDSCAGPSQEPGTSKSPACSSSHYKKCFDKGRTPKCQQSSLTKTSPSVDIQNSSPFEEGSFCTSSPRRKHHCNSKRKSNNPTSTKGNSTPVKSQNMCKARRSHSDDNDSSESLDLSVLTQALLDNKELHEKIAENINRVIRMPGSGETLENTEGQPLTTAATETASTESSPVISGSTASVATCDGMLHELNNAIKRIVHQTEQDPVFERFLEEIIGPLEDEMTPSPADMQSEGDDAQPDLTASDSGSKTINDGGSSEDSGGGSGKPSPYVTPVLNSSKEQEHSPEEQKTEEDVAKLGNDIPLKQRLRSARQRKMDATSVGAQGASPTGTSVKEKKKEGSSLEDQNAAAIESIVNARMSSLKTTEASHNFQQQKNVLSTSDTDAQTCNAGFSSDSSEDKPDGTSGQQSKENSNLVSSSQKDTACISDASGVVSGECTNVDKLVDSEKHDVGEVILFDGNLTFMESNVSLPVSTDASSNFVFSPTSIKTHLTNPPTVVPSCTSQVMAITIPGATDTLHQAAALSGIPVHPPLQQTVSHGVSSSGQVLTFAIPGTLNTVSQNMATVNPTVQQLHHELDVMSTSTVIMCGTDGMVPQFFSLPQQDASRSGYMLSGAGSSRYVPIQPRASEIPVSTATTAHLLPLSNSQQHMEICQSIVMCPVSTVGNSGASMSNAFLNPNSGTSKAGKQSTSKSKRQNSIATKRGRMRNEVGVRTRSQDKTGVVKPNSIDAENIVTLYAEDNSGEVVVSCSNVEQLCSSGSSLSLPDIVMVSPQAKISSTTTQEDGVTSSQEAGQGKLSEATDLKETFENSSNPAADRAKSLSSEEIDNKDSTHKSKMEVNGNKSTKSANGFLLQNIDKIPPSPQLLSLVNLSKNNIHSNSRHSPSVRISDTTSDTSDKKCSEIKLVRKPRETPQATTSQHRTGFNSKRTSLSTPRRHRHVRALDFTTPPKSETVRRSNTSPKTLHGKITPPKTMEKLGKSVRRAINTDKVKSTLFTSPRNEPETVANNAPTQSTTCSNTVPHIATRSPPPRLSGGWDVAAGVGQIICDDADLTKEETDYDSTKTQEESNMNEDRDEEDKTNSKVVEESAKSNKISSPKKTWDSDLRALLSADYDEPVLPAKDREPVKVRNTKKKETKLRRRSSRVTEEEVRRLEECLNEDENLNNASENVDQDSTNVGASDSVPSSSDIPVDEAAQNSEHSSEKGNLGTEVDKDKSDKSDLPGKDVDTTCEGEHTHPELSDEISMKPTTEESEPKKCVQVESKLNEEKECIKSVNDKVECEATDKTVRKRHTTNTETSDNVVQEVADTNEDYLSECSESTCVGFASPSSSVTSAHTMASSSKVIQSPTKLKAAKRTIVLHDFNVSKVQESVDFEENLETFVIQSEDVDNDDANSSAANTSGTSGETKDVSGSQSTSSESAPISQDQELVSSTSQENVSSAFITVPENPPLRKPRIQKQTCDLVTKPDPQPKSSEAPVLDTPRKLDDSSSNWGSGFLSIPLTPRVISPRPDDTPFTKQVRGQSCAVFSVIETPSFPPTPNIPVTPESCHSCDGTPSYATRQTDYSSSSSYYKPSVEQDGTIPERPLEELLIEECNKLEGYGVVRSSNKNGVQTQSCEESAAKLPCAGVSSEVSSPVDKTLQEAATLSSDCATAICTTDSLPKEPVEEVAASVQPDRGRVSPSDISPDDLISPEKQHQTRTTTKRKERGNNTKAKATPAKKKVRSVARANKADESEKMQSDSNVCEEFGEMSKENIIKRHLDDAWIKLFGCNSPSDDPDFESSGEFGQCDAEIENDEQLTKEDTVCTGQKEILSKYSRIYSDDSNTNHAVPEQQKEMAEEVRPLSRLSLSKKSPVSTWEEQIKELDQYSSLSCTTETHESKSSSENDQPDHSTHLKSDDPGRLKSRTTHYAGNAPLSNELDKKKCRTLAKLKGIDASNLSESTEEQTKTTTVPVISKGQEPLMSKEKLSHSQDKDSYGVKDKDLAKTTVAPTMKISSVRNVEATHSKKTGHLSVEAIADRLTREKIAIQAHPVVRTPVRRSQTCEDSSSEDFPALRLSSDEEDTQSEHVNFSQVEFQMAKLHGGEETVKKVSGMKTPPRPLQDVCRDLEVTPSKVQDEETGPCVSNTDNKEVGTSERGDSSRACTATVRPVFKASRKKLSPADRKENANKKIRILLGEDVSPIKNIAELNESRLNVKPEILQKLLSTPKKQKSPVKTAVKPKVQNKKESLQKSTVKGGQELENITTSVPDETSATAPPFRTCPPKAADMRSSEAAISTCPSMLHNNATVTYTRRQVAENETYIEIIYEDDGPEGNNFTFEDISTFSIPFELGDDSDDTRTYECRPSVFQNLYCASPKRSSKKSSQLNFSGVSAFGGFQKDFVKSRGRHKEFQHSSKVHTEHEGRSSGSGLREHKTVSCPPEHRRAHVSRDRKSVSYGRSRRRSPSPTYRRRTFSSHRGRRSQSLSPVASTSKVASISPLNQLYNDYKDGKRSMKWNNKRDQDLNLRRNEPFSSRKRGRARTKHLDRYSHIQRGNSQSFSRESSHTSTLLHEVTDFHGRTKISSEEFIPDKKSTSEFGVVETCSRRISKDASVLNTTATVNVEAHIEPPAIDTQIDDIQGEACGVQGLNESLEEGELMDEDSLQGINKKERAKRPVTWLQKQLSSVVSDDELMTFAVVRSVQAENSGGDMAKGSSSLNNASSEQFVEKSRLVDKKPTQEAKKPRESIQKETGFGGPSGGNSLPPKKRKASSEDLGVQQVEKRLRPHDPQALLKKVDLDHLLDFVHGEKSG